MSPLRRTRLEMPGFVHQALVQEGLLEAYQSRPPYQQNDYIAWITMAKQEQTRQKRLRQMLDELRQGDVYMNMSYRPRGVKKG